MTVSKTAISKTAMAENGKARKESTDAGPDGTALQLGELSELLGYSLKRAQLKIFEDFLRCVEPLQLTPAQFSVLLLLDKNPGRNQTEIANTLGILRPNFVAMLDGLESRDLCARIRSTNDRRSHILELTDKGRAVLARAKRLVASKHEARLNELLGPANRTALLSMLTKIASSAARLAGPSSSFSRASCLLATSRFARASTARPLSVSSRICERRSLGERMRAQRSRLSSPSSIATKLGRRIPSVLAISVWLRPGFLSSRSNTENCAGVSCSGATQRKKSSKIFNCARLSE